MVENGIKEVISVRRHVANEEMYFLVKYIDLFDNEREEKMMEVRNLNEKRWNEAN